MTSHKVGQRVSVYWPGDDAWYDGTIASYASTRHGQRVIIDYDDRESCELREGETMQAIEPIKTKCVLQSLPGTAKTRARAMDADLSSEDEPKPKRTAPSKPLVISDCSIRVKSEATVRLFYRYLYRRMCVRLQMDHDKGRPPLATILGDGVLPEVPEDQILSMATTGNAYRHLDTGTLILGADVSAALTTVGYARGSPEFFAGALMACLVDMSGINARVLREGLQLPRWDGAAPGERLLEYPCTVDELRALQSFIGRYERKQKAPGATCTKLYSDAGFQTQGFRWADYLRRWLQRPADGDGACFIEVVAAQVRRGATWQEANLTVQTLPGVGDYTGAQALLQVLFGVFGGDATLCFTAAFDVSSMRNWCAYGPGPVSACQKLFGTKASDTLAAIRWLREHQQERFAKYELPFPYLRLPDGSPQLLGACDLEHSLCYFSRYLGARERLGSQADALCREMPPGFRLFRISKLQGLSAAKVRELFAAHYEDGGASATAAKGSTFKSRHY